MTKRALAGAPTGNFSALLVALMLWKGATSAGQQGQTSPYKVLKVEKGGLAAVNALADTGYRMLVSGDQQVIMRLEGTPPDTFRYIAMTPGGGPVQFLNWVNEQGANGYRWVPGTGIMEKEPHPKNYEYSSTQGWSGKAKLAGSSLISEGYRPVEQVEFPSVFGRGPEVVFFERELGTRLASVPTGEAWDVKKVDANQADTILKKVNGLAEKGYRYLGLYVPSMSGGLVVFMRKCVLNCEGLFAYRYFDAHDVGQLTKDLNDAGKDGFRVIPEALAFRPHLLQRDSLKTEIFAYHALQAKDPNALEQALNGPEEAGYVPVGFVWRLGFKSAEPFLLLEKASTASAAP